LSELPVTTIVRQWLGTIDAERFFNVTVPGRRNYDSADLYREITGSRFAFARQRAAVGGNYDLADDTENGRIQLCIDAGSRRTVI
jgi:hypothetical protein